MAFAPAQNHEVKFSISLIHQVPSVPAKHKSWVHTEKTTETEYVPIYWCRKEQMVPGTPEGECAASLGTESETESFALSYIISKSEEKWICKYLLLER